VEGRVTRAGMPVDKASAQGKELVQHIVIGRDPPVRVGELAEPQDIRESPSWWVVSRVVTDDLIAGSRGQTSADGGWVGCHYRRRQYGTHAGNACWPIAAILAGPGGIVTASAGPFWIVPFGAMKGGQERDADGVVGRGGREVGAGGWGRAAVMFRMSAVSGV